MNCYLVRFMRILRCAPFTEPLVIKVRANDRDSAKREAFKQAPMDFAPDGDMIYTELRKIQRLSPLEELALCAD